MWLEVFCYNFYLLSIISYLLSLISYLSTLQIIFLNILEILIGRNLQFVGGRFVSNDDAVLVHL